MNDEIKRTALIKVKKAIGKNFPEVKTGDITENDINVSLCEYLGDNVTINIDVRKSAPVVICKCTAKIDKDEDALTEIGGSIAEETLIRVSAIGNTLDLTLLSQIKGESDKECEKSLFDSVMAFTDKMYGHWNELVTNQQVIAREDDHGFFDIDAPSDDIYGFDEIDADDESPESTNDMILDEEGEASDEDFDQVSEDEVPDEFKDIFDIQVDDQNFDEASAQQHDLEENNGLKEEEKEDNSFENEPEDDSIERMLLNLENFESEQMAVNTEGEKPGTYNEDGHDAGDTQGEQKRRRKRKRNRNNKNRQENGSNGREQSPPKSAGSEIQGNIHPIHEDKSADLSTAVSDFLFSNTTDQKVADNKDINSHESAHKDNPPVDSQKESVPAKKSAHPAAGKLKPDDPEPEKGKTDITDNEKQKYGQAEEKALPLNAQTNTSAENKEAGESTDVKTVVEEKGRESMNYNEDVMKQRSEMLAEVDATFEARKKQADYRQATLDSYADSLNQREKELDKREAGIAADFESRKSMIEQQLKNLDAEKAIQMASVKKEKEDFEKEKLYQLAEIEKKRDEEMNAIEKQKTDISFQMKLLNEKQQAFSSIKAALDDERKIVEGIKAHNDKIPKDVIARLDSLQSENDKIKNDLKEAERQVEMYKTSVDIAQKKESSFTQKQSQYEQTISSLKQNISELTAEITKLKNQINELSAKAEESAPVNDEEFDRMTEEIEKLRQANETLKKENGEIKGTNDKLMVVRDRQKQLIEAFKSERLKMKEDMTNVKVNEKSVAEAVKRESELKAVIKQREDESEALKADVEKKAEELKVITEERDELKERCESLQEDIAGLKESAESDAGNEKNDLSEELERIKQEKTEVEEKLKSLTDISVMTRSIIDVMAEFGIDMESVANANNQNILKGEKDGASVFINIDAGVLFINKNLRRASRYKSQIERWNAEDVRTAYYISENAVVGKLFFKDIDALKAFAEGIIRKFNELR